MRGEGSQALRQSRIGSHRAIRFFGHGGHVDRIHRHAFVEILDQMLRQTHCDQLGRLFGGAADVRRGQHLIQSQQGLAGFGRFGLQNVQRGPGDLAGFNGVAQRLHVHQFAASAVDDPHAGFHLGEGVFIQHAHGFGGQRDVQGDVVGLGVKFFAAHQRDAEIRRGFGVDIGIVGDDLHLEPACAAHHFASNAAETHHAQRLAAQLGSQESFALPFAAAGGIDGLGDLTGHGQHQAERVFRHRDGALTRHVHHQDARRCGRVQVHKVRSHTRERDDPQLLRCVDLRRRHFHRARCQQDIGIGQMLLILGGTGSDDLPARLGFQNVDSRRTQRLRDYDFHGSLNCRWLFPAGRLPGVIFLDGGHTRTQFYWNTVGVTVGNQDQLQFGHQSE